MQIKNAGTGSSQLYKPEDFLGKDVFMEMFETMLRRFDAIEKLYANSLAKQIELMEQNLKLNKDNAKYLKKYLDEGNEADWWKEGEIE